MTATHRVAAIVLALLYLVAAPLRAQDIRGLEVCTAEKQMARRTGVVAGLIADIESKMLRGAQAPGAKDLAAAF